jgi:hypothetical protein
VHNPVYYGSLGGLKLAPKVSATWCRLDVHRSTCAASGQSAAGVKNQLVSAAMELRVCVYAALSLVILQLEYGYINAQKESSDSGQSYRFTLLVLMRCTEKLLHSLLRRDVGMRCIRLITFRQQLLTTGNINQLMDPQISWFVYVWVKFNAWNHHASDKLKSRCLNIHRDYQILKEHWGKFKQTTRKLKYLVIIVENSIWLYHVEAIGTIKSCCPRSKALNWIQWLFSHLLNGIRSEVNRGGHKTWSLKTFKRPIKNFLRWAESIFESLAICVGSSWIFRICIAWGL